MTCSSQSIPKSSSSFHFHDGFFFLTGLDGLGAVGLIGGAAGCGLAGEALTGAGELVTDPDRFVDVPRGARINSSLNESRLIVAR